MIKVSDLFSVSYGVNLEFYKMTPDQNGVPFVSRQEKNNGVVGRVQRLPDVTPNEAGTISVATGGSVMASFLQEEPYYSGFHVFCLKPKQPLTKQQLLAYCMLLRANRYKYNYGRQANKTLADILLPEPEKLPKAWLNARFPALPRKNSVLPRRGQQALQVEHWKEFKLTDLFLITGSTTTSLETLLKAGKGNFPYITTQGNQNGTEGFFSIYTEKGGVLTVDSAVTGTVFFQPNNFSASDHVEKLVPQFKMNIYHALFLVTLLSKEKYRYNYGRKRAQIRLRREIIKLPVTKDGKPDWDYMERFVKTLPYSVNL